MKKHRMAAVWTALVLTFGLSGCVFQSVDELYAVPEPSSDYQALQARLSEVIGQGGEYAAPLSGDMIQSVQLQDLDGDGTQEAIAFFRVTGDEKPMKIYIYRAVGKEYQVLAVIEGAATAINSIDYVQMNDEPFKELVVSWQLNNSARTLTIYSIGSEVVELLRTDYDSYRLWDMDQDNRQELIVFRTPSESTPRMELYDYDGTLRLTGAAPFSTGAVIGTDGVVKTDYLTAVQTGYLADKTPAIFATSTYGDGAAITDIFVERNGRPVNVTLDDAANESMDTIRYYTQAPILDINSDGILEVPQPVPAAEYSRNKSSVSHWNVRWRQFDAQGNYREVMNTYYNGRDGWYFVLPDGWEKTTAMSRSDLSGGGEQAVTFSYWDGGSEEPKPFLTIYKLTGTNRELRAKWPGRFNITPPGFDDSVIYAAELKNGWDCGLTEDEVRERFAVIKTDWFS